MKKTLTVLAAGAALAVATVAAPQHAEARWGGGWHGGGWHHGGGWRGGAVLGGLAAGALIGGALASPYYGYGYYGGPYYGGYAGYDEPYYHCWRHRVWTPYGWHWRRVCR